MKIKSPAAATEAALVTVKNGNARLPELESFPDGETWYVAAGETGPNHTLTDNTPSEPKNRLKRIVVRFEKVYFGEYIRRSMPRQSRGVARPVEN